MGIIWTIIIGFVAGVIAKLVTPGSNEPSGFIPDNRPWNCGCVRCFLVGSSLGMVRPRRRRRSNRRCRRSNSRPADLGCCYAAADARPN